MHSGRSGKITFLNGGELGLKKEYPVYPVQNLLYRNFVFKQLPLISCHCLRFA